MPGFLPEEVCGRDNAVTAGLKHALLKQGVRGAVLRVEVKFWCCLLHLPAGNDPGPELSSIDMLMDLEESCCGQGRVFHDESICLELSVSQGAPQKDRRMLNSLNGYTDCIEPDFLAITRRQERLWSTQWQLRCTSHVQASPRCEALTRPVFSSVFAGL